MGEELTVEHEIAEGDEELTGSPAIIRAVPEEDGFHGGIGPSRSAGTQQPQKVDARELPVHRWRDSERGGLDNGE